MKYFEMKKRAFMSIVNAVKGFIRKVSGTPPITLPDCVDDDSLISYSLGLEDTRDNLYNQETLLTFTDYASQYVTKADDGSYRIYPPSAVREHILWNNTEGYTGQIRVIYTVKYEDAGTTPEGWAMEGSVIAVRYTDGTMAWLNGGHAQDVLSGEFYTIDFTSQAGKVVQRVGLGYSYQTVTYLKDIMVTKNIELTEYVPYVEPETLGDKTKNLLDITKYKTQYNPKFTLENGVLDFTYYTWTHHLYYEIKGLKPSTNYTFSMLSNTQAQMYYNDVNWFAATTKTADGYYTCAQTIKSSSTGTMKIAFKYGNDDNGFSCKAWNLQLVEGTTTTEYEPFGYKIPIKMSGKNLFNPTQTSYTANGLTITRNTDNTYTVNGTATAITYIYLGRLPIDVNKVYYGSGGVANTSESGITGNAYLAFQHLIGGAIKKTIPNRGGVSKLNVKFYEEYIDEYNLIYCVHADTTVNNVIVKPMISHIGTDEYEPYINPITTNIILDEPLIAGNVLEYPKEDIPKLPTVKGTTIYSVETEVQPSNMSVEYYSTRKGK